MQNNILILILHTAGLSLITLACLRRGAEFIKIWLALLTVGMNLFALKQITLFGLEITCSDTLAVGYLLGLNLIQEFFGRKEAVKTIWTTCFASLAFLALSLLTLLYTPSPHDQVQELMERLFLPQLRLITASLATFLIVQYFDLRLFSKLRQKTQGRWLTLRTMGSLLCAQTLDTVLFSYLGLYGLVYSVTDIILFSLITKSLIILLSAPYVALSRKVLRAL